MENRTVLIVDDDSSILNANVRIFKQAGWRILTANSAKEAISLLPQADVVLSDFHMVGGNGDQVVDAAGDTPVVLYTGMPQGIKHAYVLTKPSSHDSIIKTVTDALFESERHSRR